MALELHPLVCDVFQLENLLIQQPTTSGFAKGLTTDHRPSQISVISVNLRLEALAWLIARPAND
jgi:hypothetical protein